jgi:hypothetical protein
VAGSNDEHVVALRVAKHEKEQQTSRPQSLDKAW